MKVIRVWGGTIKRRKRQIKKLQVIEITNTKAPNRKFNVTSKAQVTAAIQFNLDDINTPANAKRLEI